MMARDHAVGSRVPTLPLVTIARVVALTLVTAGLTACQFGDAVARSDPAKTGGTLHVVVAARPTHFDPQRIRTPTEANLSRLITRTLTTYRATSGSRETEVVGDLATDAGRPSEANRVWEFTLKPGVKWQDGSPLTCDDVKYGIERSFVEGVFDVAQRYPRQFLRDNAVPYQGPYVEDNNGGKGLESVACPAVDSIQFTLKYPIGDFGRIVAAPVFAPVPKAADTGAKYDTKPVSSGPYRVERIEANAVFYARNLYWNRAGDPVRRAYPDQIVVTVSSDSERLTRRIVDSGDDTWANTALLDQDVAPGDARELTTDAELSQRVHTGPTDGVRFLAINTTRVRSVDCRRALSQAFNRRAYRDAIGGEFAGAYATTIIPPRLRAHRDFDPLGALAAPEGVPEAAKPILAGKSCPKSLNVAFPNRRDVRSAISTMVEPYRAVGVEIKQRALDPDHYGDLVGSPASDHDLAYVEWMPDWPSGAAVVPQLFDGRLIASSGASNNQNLSLMNDSGVDEAITEALTEESPERQHVLWGELDERIQASVPTIPLLYPRAVRLVGTNVRGGYVHTRFGQLDVCALGLADPSVRPDGLGAGRGPLS